MIEPCKLPCIKMLPFGSPEKHYSESCEIGHKIILFVIIYRLYYG